MRALARDPARHDHPDDIHPLTEYIAISFVRVWDKRVRGTLDAYRDPVCGCRLVVRVQP